MTIAIYSRKSKFTGQGDSIGNQLEICRREAIRYLERQGLSPEDAQILEYEDEGYSGKNTARPQFRQMMAAVRAGRVACVICYKLDRISRNTGDFALLFEEFKNLGVQFICTDQNIDTSTPMGEAMMKIASVFAELERNTIAERIRDNMHLLARDGRWLGGRTPFGFASGQEKRTDMGGKERTSFRLLPNREELALVSLIYRIFRETPSVAATVRYLAQRDIKTRSGKEFSPVAVKGILRNPVYCVADEDAHAYFLEKNAVICYQRAELGGGRGFMTYNRTSQTRSGQVPNQMSQWLVAVGRHQGVVPGTQWVGAQRILDAKRTGSPAAKREPHRSPALLSGLLRCGMCGDFLRPHVHTGRKRSDGTVPFYYICQRKERSLRQSCAVPNVRGETLDRLVCDELLEFATAPALGKALRGLRQRISAGKAAEPDPYRYLEERVAANEAAVKNLLRALGEDGGDSAAERIRGRINELSEQTTALRAELTRRLPGDGDPSSHPSVDAAVQALACFRQVLDAAPTHEKRTLLRALIHRVVWDGETAHIFLSGARETPETAKFMLPSPPHSK